MATNKPRAMMFWVEAWKSSPAVAAMNPIQRSMYFELLCSMWLNGGYLPSDEKTLAAAARVSVKVFRRESERVLSNLVDTPRGVTNEKLLEEYERDSKYIETSREHGRQGAQKRWSKDQKTDSHPIGVPIPPEYKKRVEDAYASSPSLLGGRPQPIGAPSYRPDLTFDRFYALCLDFAPEKSPRLPIERAWAEIVLSAEIEEQVIAGFEAWKLGRDWRHGIIKRFDRWLLDLDFERPPKPKKPKVDPYAYSNGADAPPEYGFPGRR